MSSINGLIVTNNKDFCEEFGNNGFEVDFGYEHTINERFIFIANNYWKLEVTENQKHFYINQNYSKDGKNADLLPKKFDFAFRTKVCADTELGELVHSPQCRPLTAFFKVTNFDESVLLKPKKLIDFRQKEMSTETILLSGNQLMSKTKQI